MKKIIVIAAVLVMAFTGNSQASQVFFSTDKQASAAQVEFQKASSEQDERFFNKETIKESDKRVCQ